MSLKKYKNLKIDKKCHLLPIRNNVTKFDSSDFTHNWLSVNEISKF